MKTTRKTAKYYREQLNIVKNCSMLNSLIKELVDKYGSNRELSIDGNKCNWNHWVDGFYISPKNELFVSVYWQGDSTDGTDYVSFNELFNRGKCVIRSKSFWDGNRTRIVHSDINVEKYELDNLISLLIEWLSPNAIKERKIKAEITKLKGMVNSKMGNEYYQKYSRRFGANEEYYNGRGAVAELMDKKAIDFIKMDFDEVMEIIDKVFRNNYKTDRCFGGGSFMRAKEPYNLSY
jgi:hypothetical protein